MANFENFETLLSKNDFTAGRVLGEWALGEDDYVYFLPSTPGQSPNDLNMSAALAPRIFDIQV
jgi:hypothetical protein